MKYICSLIVIEDMAVAKEFYTNILKQQIKYDFGENVTFAGDLSMISFSETNLTLMDTMSLSIPDFGKMQHRYYSQNYLHTAV